MTECDEVAGSMARAAPFFQNYEGAVSHVRLLMIDESETVISNVAESLYRSQQ